MHLDLHRTNGTNGTNMNGTSSGTRGGSVSVSVMQQMTTSIKHNTRSHENDAGIEK